MENNKNPKFKDFKEQISKSTLSALKSMGFKRMTDIQADVIPKALNGADVVATAKTGSGKTLAFLIPVVELTTKMKNENKEGTFSIIISPTRELATQTYTVLQKITSHYESITSALLIGGESRKYQTNQLVKGVNIVVATPGRLFDHMRTKEFDYRLVSCLVLDEADKIFQYGFEEDVRQIINRLPKNRQTMLFSATHSEITDALVKSAMRGIVHTINADEDNDRATVEGLQQGYVICETQYRLHWLHKLLKKTHNSKVMVFFSSCKSVEFHHRFLSEYCGMSILCIHGKMTQADRTTTMSSFRAAQSAALLCTDVAARGLDIPAVDWVVQFDPPGDSNEYVHRVGRTARAGSAGRAVLLLRPEEEPYVEVLRGDRVHLDKYQLWERYSDLRPKLEAALRAPRLRGLAEAALEGCVRALRTRPRRHALAAGAPEAAALARSFGLAGDALDALDAHLGFSKKHRPRKRLAAQLANDNELSKT